MAIDIRRLRLMNQDAQGVVDITRPMGSSGYGPDDQEYEPPPEYDTGEEYSYGGNETRSSYEDPDEAQYSSPVMDPRTPVNPTIAQPVAGPGSSGDEAMNRTIDAINRIYRPEYTSRDRLNRLLDAAPEREQPSVLSGIAAFGMGMNAKDPLDALKVHEQVMFAPHHRAMADWTAKTQPFSNAAQYENTANINERTLAGNVVTAQTQADRLAESARQADQKNEVARMTANIRQAVANKWTIEEANGRMMAYPPRPDMGNPMDLGPSGMLSEREKIDLINSGRLAVVNQQGSNQLAVQASRNAGQLAVQTLRNQRVTGNGSTRGLLPSQQKDAYYNKAQEWIRRNPQDAEHITLEPTQRDFSIEEPGTSIFGNPRGMPPERYDAFIDYIYGSGAMAAPATPSGMPTPPNAPALPQGAGPQAPAMPGQPQGQLTVPSRDDPRFQTPPGFDPHGRPPQSVPQGQPQQQGAPQQQNVPQVQGQVQPTPQQVQAVNQINQEIAQLEAQLGRPAYSIATDEAITSDPSTPRPSGPRISAQPNDDPFAQPETTNFGPGISGAIDYIRGSLRPQAQAPQPTQQQQIQARIAELRKQQEQIMNSVVTPANQQQGQPQPILQVSPSTGMQRISYDGGKTWVPYSPQAGR